MRYNQIDKCRICGNQELIPLLNLGNQALTGVFPRTRNEPIATAPLQLVKCHESPGNRSCGLVQLLHSADPAAMFGASYGYRSGLNRSMIQHLLAKAAEIKAYVSLEPGDLVLDIGSNDGTFLHGMKQPGVTLLGMDPTVDKFRRFYPQNAVAVPEMFSAARFREIAGGRKAKVVTSIAMFYDLEAPLDFVRQVREVLAPGGVWVLEQSYLPLMLGSGAYDTICHEHLEYYSLRQLVWLADRAGLRIVGAKKSDVNGGSFSVSMVHASAPTVAGAAVAAMLVEEQEAELDREPVYRRFAERSYRHRDALLQRLCEGRSRGQRIFGYGASTKGNVMLQFAGIGPAELPCIAEVNPDKFGCFAPGSGIPIVSEPDAHRARPDAFLVLPWHFRANTLQRERKFLRQGGGLIFPLPSMEEFGARRLATTA